MEEASDIELVERIRAGDETAFAALVVRYQAPVRGLTALWAPSADEAEDLAQEVFLAALRSINTFDESRDLKTWLLGIARNLTRQAWSRVNRTRNAGSETLDAMLEKQAMLVYSSREANSDHRRDALERCIGSLPENSRDIFSRYVVDELSSRELAELLATTESNIRATISRIRRGLRICIERRLQSEAAQ